MTKNIPVSNSTEMICNSISPVATGNLSQLSNCMNGEKTAINTIRMSTIWGNLCGIVLNQLGTNSACGASRPEFPRRVEKNIA